MKIAAVSCRQCGQPFREAMPICATHRLIARLSAPSDREIARLDLLKDIYTPAVVQALHDAESPFYTCLRRS